jgi:RHS repeat-associated protein
MGHDSNGNTLTQTNISTGTVTYFTWDYQNRLTEVKVETSTGTVLNDEKFTYDVFGNRIGVSLNGTQTLYTVYDGSNPYMDFNGSGTLTERYLTNPTALSQFYGQVSAGGTVQWFLTDNIDSIREVVDSSGNSLDVIAYDPWGTILSQSNAANAPRFLYTGGAYDAITGMHTDGAREENPMDGRWMSRDPLGFKAGDLNRYRYVFNSPMTFTDPSGLARMAAPPPPPLPSDNGIPDSDSSLIAGSDTFHGNWNQSLAVIFGITNEGQANDPPPNLSPPGSGRSGAFRAAKRANSIPVGQQPLRVEPNKDRRGKVQPGCVYVFIVQTKNGPKEVRIRDDAEGHYYGPNDPQNRGPHFNDENGGHYDY